MNDGALKTVYNIFNKYKTDVFFNINNLNIVGRNNPNNLDNLNNINNLNNNITNFDLDNIDDSDMDNFNKMKLMNKLKYYEEKEKHYGFISSIIQSKHIIQSIQTEPSTESIQTDHHIELIQTEPLVESVQTEQNVQSTRIESSEIHEVREIVKINETEQKKMDERDRQKLLIHNIMMVGNIKPYEKFWLENDTLTLDTNYFQRYTRWKYSQKREIIIDFIEKIVRECIKILDKNNNENVHNIVRNSILVSCVDIVVIDSVDEIQEQSVLVVNGLKNMRITYPDKVEKINKIIDLLETNKIDLLTSRFM